MSFRLHMARAFAQTLWVSRLSRPRFEAWQARRIRRWMRHDLRQVGFYRAAPMRLDQLPETDKALQMADFHCFNREGITHDAARAAWQGEGHIGDVSIGASTGTSGNRALYCITEAERARWLGTILAKALPRFLIQRERVAVILPQSSALYDGANQSRALELRFFDLREGPESWINSLEGFAPTTIVAPPRVLRLLAEETALAPRRVFAGGETLDPMDRALIEARFGALMGQVYMASEGLFGVTCAHGRLHLAEDANHFELEEVGHGLVSPLISSFSRSFQIMARYRMNDLLRMDPRPCPCGSPLQVAHEVVGRADDSFAFGGGLLVTPDVIRNAVLDACPELSDFRVRHFGGAEIELALPQDLDSVKAESIRSALGQVFAKRGLNVHISLQNKAFSFDPSRKLRRVEAVNLP